MYENMDISVVKSCALFDGLRDVQRDAALSCLGGGFMDYQKSQTLIREGDRVDRIGIVIKGSITTSKLDRMGNASLLYTLESPFLFGLDTCLTPSRISPVFIMAAADVRVFTFPCDNLTNAPALNEAVRSRMLLNALHVLANENMRRMYKIELLNQKSLRARILMYLNLMSRRKDARSFTIPFNREQLAQYLGVNRSSLSHELSLMQREGILSFYKNQFTLHDADNT